MIAINSSEEKKIFVSTIGPGGPYYATFRPDKSCVPFYAVGNTRREAIRKIVKVCPEAADTRVEPE